MVNKILLLFFVISISVFSQDEKRLALVIGNAVTRAAAPNPRGRC